MVDDGSGDGEGVEGADDDGWNEQQEEAFQQEKQLAYEVLNYGVVVATAATSLPCRCSRTKINLLVEALCVYQR